jgi:hypothetical protein
MTALCSRCATALSALALMWMLQFVRSLSMIAPRITLLFRRSIAAAAWLLTCLCWHTGRCIATTTEQKTTGLLGSSRTRACLCWTMWTTPKRSWISSLLMIRCAELVCANRLQFEGLCSDVCGGRGRVCARFQRRLRSFWSCVFLRWLF